VIPQTPGVPQIAWVRRVADTYADCLRPPGPPIAVEIALREHAGYVDALRDVGVDVRFLPEAPALPDGVFVEDVAIVLAPALTVLTRPGVHSRVAEVETLESALSGELAHLPEGATLEGGDVLRWGDTLFVGISARTNTAGVDALAAIARAQGMRVVSVRVRSGLHLKSACTLLDAHTLLYLPERIDLAPLRDAGLEAIAVEEAQGANVLALGRHVLVSAAAPRPADLGAARGHEPIAVRIDQFHLGDGALTCLSLRVPAVGQWCA
jgi:dimethylargininase